jgi:UDP-glucose 4-epimerase
MTRRIWVTGADGFIGRHLLRLLGQQQGVIVGALGFRDGMSVNDDGDVVWSEGEIDDARLEALADAMGAPDIVYHLAGGGSVGASLTDPVFDFRCTVLSTAAITDWIRRRAPDARMIQISSAAVYGAGYDGPISEDASLAPYSPYGTHKQMSEALCRSARLDFGLDCWILRPFSVYGPGLRKQLLWDSCIRIAAGCETLSLGGTGEERRDWLHVADLCSILLCLSDASPTSGTTINAGNGEFKTVAEIGQLLVAAWGKPAMPVEFSGQSRPGDPHSLIADTRRLSALGFAPQHKVDDGIADFVHWFRTQ